MKNLMIICLFFLLTACQEETFKVHRQNLYDQLAGEWRVERLFFPSMDSTMIMNNSSVAFFQACNSDDDFCSGYFNFNDEVLNFTYHAEVFEDIGKSTLHISPEQGQTSDLYPLQVVASPILEIQEGQLTINLAYCSYDAENNCNTIDRHTIMSR